MDTTPAKKPVQRPAHRGVCMDFAPVRRPVRGPRPVQPLQPAAKPSQPRPAVKPQLKPASGPVHRPQAPRPIHQQTIVQHHEEKQTTILYPDANTIATETTQISYNTDDSLGIIEDVDPEVTEQIADEFVEEPKPLDTEEAPKKKTLWNNMKSPFITTKVEKRPLSGDKPTPEEKAQKKIVYPHRTDLAKKPVEQKSNKVPTVVTTKAGMKSNIRLIISIIITVILGALVGTVVYLAFFQ